MNARKVRSTKLSVARRLAKGRNTSIRANGNNRRPKQARRAGMKQVTVCEPFAPPEDWYESTGATKYRIVVQEPGEGYRHVLTPAQIRARLAQVPQHFLKGLEVVQLSKMTRKKQLFPCYGMQWGNTLYLYPIEESFVEHYDTAPRPNLMNESRMYGGQWDENPDQPGAWTLTWSKQAAEDFYLNNILIHELGHLVDDRNTTYMDRERYAEWFAVQHGYLASGGRESRDYPLHKTRRRHHAGKR
jgi:hypothetical protein